MAMFICWETVEKVFKIVNLMLNISLGQNNNKLHLVRLGCH